MITQYARDRFADKLVDGLGTALSFVTVILAIGVTLVAFCVGVYVYFDRNGCLETWALQAENVQWSFHSGCMVHVGGRWLSTRFVGIEERDGKAVFVPREKIK
ncbi:MAG: hypothetical protein ACM31O_04505 [Bacteroidota bacterium]